MSVCLADNFEGVELILRIVLGREDIKVKSVRTQEPLKNLQGRSCDCGAIMVIWIILGLPSSSQTEIAYCLIQ